MSGEETITQAIIKIVAERGGEQKDIVSLLQAIQEEFNYLPQDALKSLAKLTKITPSTIMGVATFYSRFRFKPAGRHMIKVCVGTACHIKGAEEVYEAFKTHLAIPLNEDTDANQLFTVEKVACLGCCMLATAVQIDNITYGHVTRDTVPQVLRDFLNACNEKISAGQTSVVQGGMRGTVKICLCSSCSAAGALYIHQELQKIIFSQGLNVQLKNVGCTGMSFQCPMLEIESMAGNTYRYSLVAKEDVAKILTGHFTPGKFLPRIKNHVLALLEKLYYSQENEPVTRYILNVRDPHAHPYLSSQKQIATLQSGKLDPLDIDEYIANGGFGALEKCLAMPPEKVVQAIKESGLRGRGGAGFSTAVKWAAVRASPREKKYLICNGDEGDPGAFMDRLLLESFPYRVIEGMAIAAYACGIKNGLVFLRAEYPLAISRVQQALQKFTEHRRAVSTQADDGLMKLELVTSAGAYICGEETAMIASIQGMRGTPRVRPPYPSEEGLWGAPTLVNNVETLALIPWIILHGAGEFSKLGTETSRGTKTFALAGKIRNGGLIEVEMGTTLRKIIYEIGGGVFGDRPLKAVQIGGPAGGCLPASLIDTPVDYETLKLSGTIMGSGGMIVLDDTDCMVEVARYFMSFTQNEACGKCTFGRVGTKRMLEILEKFTLGIATAKDLKQLEYLGVQVRAGSLCGLCAAAPNPVLSALRFFASEFDDHINGRCPAKKCKALFVYRVTESCIGCTKCAQRCPVDAIEIRPYRRHEIDQSKCIKCDSCRLICPQKAVEKFDARGV